VSQLVIKVLNILPSVYMSSLEIGAVIAIPHLVA